MSARWFKKYTEMKHIEDILGACSLHLGDPAVWQDKNDAELIAIYAEATSVPIIRATCLTMAADRFHFWTVFGQQNGGVCFWFDRNSLLADIKRDTTLVAQNVLYRKPRNLRELPFSKRSQYADEREFRVLKPFQSKGGKSSFSFSPASLRRIYLNAWLTPDEVLKQRERIERLLGGKLGHVEVLQSRVLRRQQWIDDARHVAASG